MSPRIALETVGACAVVVSVMASGPLGCCNARSAAQTRADAVSGQQRVSKKLAAIRASLASAPAPGKTPCPPSLSHAPYVLTTDEAYLDRFSSSGAVAPAPKDPLWDFIRSKTLRVLEPEADISSSDVSVIQGYVRTFEQRRYVVVLTDPNRKPARYLGSSDPIQYDGGSFDGMMRVFDSETGRLLCQAPVKAQSSDSVRYFDQGLLAQNPQEAVTSDFGVQLTKSAKASMAEIAPGLHIQIPQ